MFNIFLKKIFFFLYFLKLLYIYYVNNISDKKNILRTMPNYAYSHISFGFYPSSFDGYDYCAPFFESGGTDRSIKKVEH